MNVGCDIVIDLSGKGCAGPYTGISEFSERT